MGAGCPCVAALLFECRLGLWPPHQPLWPPDLPETLASVDERGPNYVIPVSLVWTLN